MKNRLSAWFERKDKVRSRDGDDKPVTVHEEPSQIKSAAQLRQMLSRRLSRNYAASSPQTGELLPFRRHTRTSSDPESASVAVARATSKRTPRPFSLYSGRPLWARRSTAPPADLHQFNPFWDAESTGSTTSLSIKMDPFPDLDMRSVTALQTPTFDSAPVFVASASEVGIVGEVGSVDPFRKAPAPPLCAAANAFFMSAP
ncbi:hypothetical protein CPB85DRAFT_1271194 [Mucidula mucida]|nr:hypothetical protein CPB85DRAFT_1271194 [Mucidula mucida]